MTLSAVHDDGGDKRLVACGRLADYRCAYGFARDLEDGGISLDAASVNMLGIEPGQTIAVVRRS